MGRVGTEYSVWLASRRPAAAAPPPPPLTCGSSSWTPSPCPRRARAAASCPGASSPPCPAAAACLRRERAGEAARSVSGGRAAGGRCGCAWGQQARHARGQHPRHVWRHLHACGERRGTLADAAAGRGGRSRPGGGPSGAWRQHAGRHPRRAHSRHPCRRRQACRQHRPRHRPHPTRGRRPLWLRLEPRLELWYRRAEPDQQRLSAANARHLRRREGCWDGEGLTRTGARTRLRSAAQLAAADWHARSRRRTRKGRGREGREGRRGGEAGRGGGEGSACTVSSPVAASFRLTRTRPRASALRGYRLSYDVRPPARVGRGERRGAQRQPATSRAGV